MRTKICTSSDAYSLVGQRKERSSPFLLSHSRRRVIIFVGDGSLHWCGHPFNLTYDAKLRKMPRPNYILQLFLKIPNDQSLSNGAADVGIYRLAINTSIRQQSLEWNPSINSTLDTCHEAKVYGPADVRKRKGRERRKARLIISNWIEQRAFERSKPFH